MIRFETARRTDRIDHESHEDSPDKQAGPSYGRFLAMILTSMVVMYVLTYVNTYELGHVQWSETRFFMVLIMGAAMAIVMLGFMTHMYKDPARNAAIVLGSIALFATSLFLVRSQTTVQDESWMRAMIPHHSIAILTSERAEVTDLRVAELAREIVEAQRREISEMEWLIADIEENGEATTAADAEARPVPDFSN